MEELIRGSIDAAVGRHIPEVTIENCIVKIEVGSAPYPMTEAHFIEWIAMKTKRRS